MNGGYFSQAGSFLFDTVISLYMVAVLLRFLFQLHGADFYNPAASFIVNITNPPLRFLRRFIPGLYGLDLSALVLLFVLALLKTYLVKFPGVGALRFSGVFLITLGELLQFVVYFYIFAIIIRALMSWVATGAYHPVMGLLERITEPLMRPARSLIPAMSGLDLSPILIIVALNLVLILVAAPLIDLGYQSL